MFNFFKIKKPETKEIKEFNDGIKAIKYFIATENWEKSKKAIDEINLKEKRAYSELMEEIEKDDNSDINDTEKRKQIKIYNNKISKLKDFREKTENSEKKYNEKVEKERFSIRFTKIKNEIDILSKTKKNSEAFSLLGNFLEENKDKHIVIYFYNKEKKKIQKNIEKERKAEEEKMKKDAKLEAFKLIGEVTHVDEFKEKKESEKKESFFSYFKEKLNFYTKVKEVLKQKRLFDEINLLIEEDDKAKKDMASKKLENIHKGLIKEFSNDKILGYDFYGKILGADKISGDTFGFTESNKKYNFFLGDATGHGIKAGFIVALLSRVFNKFVEKSSLRELSYEINNGLKQDLKNRNFITGVFFEIKKDEIGKINFVGMGHEPMLVYKDSLRKIEEIIPGGLAAGIRLIKNKEDVKIKNITLENEDILLIYSDGIIEARNVLGDFYGIKRLEDAFCKISKIEKNLNKIYEYIIKDLKIFRGGTNFIDDASILILKRNENKDIMKGDDNKYIKELSLREGLNKKQTSSLEGKTKNEIRKKLEIIRKEKGIKKIIKTLENLYYTGEILKLKQETIRFIKKGYIDKKINFYLKKAIENESRYKIDQKSMKVNNKYNIMKELLKKGEYKTVIKEAEDIISKDGNI